MSEKMLNEKQEIFDIFPIGLVRRRNGEIRIEILEPFRPALKHLEHFSHVIVFWWADRRDNEASRSMLQTRPPYAGGILTGVFACRTEYRPNPIAMTVCKMSGIDEKNGIVRVTGIDAYDGTRIIDLKPYIPICDRLKEMRIPDWLSDWPDWMPEDGIWPEG